jgi:NAD-dependent SIR2 family protein deacetylase
MADFQVTKCTDFVFILGAGASAPFGVPVMRSFMARARERYFEIANQSRYKGLADSYLKMFEFQDACLKSSWAVNRDWNNIEELYTQADLLRIGEISTGFDAEALCRDLAWGIWDVYRHVPKRIDITWESIARSIAHFCGEQVKPSIITTNYDNVCEIGIRNNRMQFYYPGFAPAWQPSAETAWLLREERISDYSGFDKVIPVIKLHGSVNWFTYDESGDAIAMSSLGPCGGNPTEVNGSGFDTHAVQQELSRIINVKAELVPAIVPPMLGKMSVMPAIRRQWSAAVSVLSRAKHIAIVGYSFPVTDAFMPRLLAEGLRANPGIESIVICDKQPREVWEPRLSGIFNRASCRVGTSDIRDSQTFLQRLDNVSAFPEAIAF